MVAVVCPQLLGEGFFRSRSSPSLLYRNQYSFVLLLFVILISLPLQYFYKYDCDYPSDDKTRQTLPKLCVKKHFPFSFTR